KPLISAWIGQGNFGDELLGYGLRSELYKLANINQIDYYEAGKYPIYHGDDDVSINTLISAEHRTIHRLARYWALRCYSYDLALFGGGSILHSEKSISWKHHLLKQFRKKNKLRGGVAAGVGISLGPYKTS